MRRTPAPIAAFVGTRPEAIKMAPVLRALQDRGLPCALVCTGQHPELDLPGAGISRHADRLALDPRDLHADAMCERIEAVACKWLELARPGVVLVQGDTNSALGAARAAVRLELPLAHIEAGLRTFDPDDPWPEERNRTEIDRISDLLFAPTRAACDNLLKEGVRGTVYLSGNSGIDAVLKVARELPIVPGRPERPMILVTAHRRENRGTGVRAIGAALRRIAAEADVAIAIPLHPNAQARAEMMDAVADIRCVALLEPQSHSAMVALMLQSDLILTDSGGLQEEAPALGRPVLILRASTERAEAIECGSAVRVGTDPDRIVAETLRLLRDREALARMSISRFPFGSGGAGTSIAATIAGFLRHREAPEHMLDLDSRLKLIQPETIKV